MKKTTEYEAGARRDDSKLWAECASGSDEAREQLILANRPMVYWLAKKLKVPYNTYQDLIQEGMLALINAVDSFDPGRNICFSTYAYYKINGRMINFLQRVEAKAPTPVEDAAFESREEEGVAFSDASSRSEWSTVERCVTRVGHNQRACHGRARRKRSCGGEVSRREQRLPDTQKGPVEAEGVARHRGLAGCIQGLDAGR